MRYYNVYTYASALDNNKNYPPSKIRLIEMAAQQDPVPLNAIRMSLTELNSYKAQIREDINAWVASKVTPATVANKKVKKAIKDANDLIKTFAAENIVMGITQAGKTKLIADALKDVYYYAQTGSLYECLSSLDSLVITEEMSPFLTTERRDNLKADLIAILTSL